ncbi:CheR family methyltransferase [Mesoterricola silvestris]|nr:protein-glutamate O-methyltransferase CheR [Mesoterricola silvestris]
MPSALDPKTFERLRTLLHARTGIHLGPGKLPMVQSRLNRRLRHLGLGTYPEYLAWLESDPGGAEWTAFINALTTNLTRFFREEHHFSKLTQWLRSLDPLPRPIRVWCAGCSTGEEPYSVAMVLHAEFPGSPARILATDLDSAVLQEARAGIYDQARVKDLPAAWLRLAFLKGRGGQAGRVRVRPEVGALVDFHPMNLLEGNWPGPSSFEVIFCRNVMIYFDKETQREIVRRFHRTLVPGGLLMVGHSESLMDASLGFESLGGTVFRRRDP